MRLVQLNNHSERQDFLRKAATIAGEDQAVDKSYLTEELITRSQELHKKYQEENANLGKANTEKSAQVERQFLAMQELRQGISHFHAVVSMRNKRLGLPKSYMKMYQIPQDQNVSSITSLPKLIRLANNCISGDAQSQLKGKDPMVNPSPEEIQSLIEDAEKVEKAYNAADRDLVDIQNKLDKLRVPLNELRTDMQAQFNKSTRDMEASRKRRIMRRYGFVYTSADPSQEELDSEAAESLETTGMEPPAEQREELALPNQTEIEPESSELLETPKETPPSPPQTERPSGTIQHQENKPVL